MVLDKCFQEWYGEHTFEEIAPEDIDTELQKFKDCVKLKYDALPDKLQSPDSYEELVNNFIKNVLKITKGGKKRKRKTTKKRTTKRRKICKRRKTCKKRK
jgi:hypothetical protein